MKIGTKVTFHPKVFKTPYKPYYDVYAGHTFLVIGFMEDEGKTIENHVLLSCITDENLPVAGYVHTDELLIAN